MLTQQFRHAPPVSSYMPRNQDLYGYLPRFRHLGNTKLPSFAVAWPANLQKLLYCSCIVTYDVIYCARDKCRRTIKTDKQTRKVQAVRALRALRLVKNEWGVEFENEVSRVQGA